MPTSTPSPPASSARFSALERDLLGDDHIELLSVGVDIGSSTSHLAFSRLVLERQGARYIVAERSVLYESGILFTPYREGLLIDGDALHTFVEGEFARAGLVREQVDTGALILTGTAVLKRNAPAIGRLFADEAGRFVAVSAGDVLEATMAAHGSGAVAASAGGRAIMNVDIGGGTSKVAVCRDGQVASLAAIEVGARLVAFDPDGRITRLEEAGRRFGAWLGLDLAVGGTLEPTARQALAAAMADRLFEVVGRGPLSDEARSLLRTAPLSDQGPLDALSFSGGVSEFVYGRQREGFGDLGDLLAVEVRRRAEALGVPLRQPAAGIRATVIGASQYTVQVSGNTIFVSTPDAVPLRSLPVISPSLPLDDEDVDPRAVEAAVAEAVGGLARAARQQPLALSIRWQGSATFGRLDGLCRGIVAGLDASLSRGHPLVLVTDGDVGGLLGLHAREELRLPNPIVSIDGVDLRAFDYVDIGSIIPASGAVPVVVKSLVFPTAGGA